MLSGYLYGNKKIKDIDSWLMNRLFRLYVPLILYGICMSIITVCRGGILPSIKENVFFLLNLHGLNFILYNMSDLAWGPWFFTVIMFCYFFVVIYQLLEQRWNKIGNILFHYGGIFTLVILVLFAYLGVSITLSFLVGFGLRKREILEGKKPYNIVVAIITAIIAVTLRLGTNRFIDGTILYNNVIVVISHCMLAAAFFIGVRWLFDMCGKTMISIASSNVMRWLDKISIYVYISHDWFIKEMFGLGISLPVEFLLYFIEVFIVASILYICGDRVSKVLEKVVV